MVMVNYAIRINGISSIALTKVDVLSGLNEVKVCTAYKHNGDELTSFPANMRILAECQPVYESLKGWDEFPKEDWYAFLKKGYDSLPENLRGYITYIEHAANTPVGLLSFGPERALTIER